MRILKDVQQSGTAVLMITHDMELVLRYAERLFVLDGGAVRFDGDPFAVLDRPGRLRSAHIVVPARAQLGAATGDPARFYPDRDRSRGNAAPRGPGSDGPIALRSPEV